jgi:hypothetical protein
MIHRDYKLSSFLRVELYLNWDCGISAGDGKFSESQSISVNKYVTNKMYCATFSTACHK